MLSNMDLLNWVLTLLSLLASGGVAWLTPRVYKLIDAHLKGKKAQVAKDTYAALSTIAVNVVHSFNQSLVGEAKAQGKFTPDLQEDVKTAAVAAVKAHAGDFMKVAEKVMGDVNGAIGAMVEKAVVDAKSAPTAIAPAQSTPAPAPAEIISK